MTHEQTMQMFFLLMLFINLAHFSVLISLSTFKEKQYEKTEVNGYIN